MSCALPSEWEIFGGNIVGDYGESRLIRRIEVASAPQAAAQAIRDAIITAKFKA